MMKMQKFARQAIGFTLIELMIVIAIIGILAAVAIPQYQKYAVRSKATQAINAIRPLQLAMAEYSIMNQTLPASVNSLPGVNIADDGLVAATCNGIVESVTYAKQTNTQAYLTAKFYADQADSDCGGTTKTLTIPTALSGKNIRFVGDVNGVGAITWSVDGGVDNSVAGEFLPELGSGTESTGG